MNILYCMLWMKIYCVSFSLYIAGIDFIAPEQMSITLTASSESDCVMIMTIFDDCQTNLDKQFQILMQLSASTEPDSAMVYMPDTTNITITNRKSTILSLKMDYHAGALTYFIIVVDLPAMPNITNVMASSTSITITWDQNTTSDVIWYELRYNFTIRGCEIQSDNYTIDMIEGSRRNYTLENSTTTPVEEYSAYTIFLSANNYDGASDTSIMEVSTQQSSEFNLLYTTHII